MSHQTGKRVLTASTTLALAAVGLAVSPIAAHAAVMTKTVTDGCGTADFLVITQPTGTDATASTRIKGYSVNGGAMQSLPAANASGEISIPLTSYATVAGVGAPLVGDGLKVDLIAEDNTIVVGAAAASYKSAKCVISNIGAQASDPAYAVTAPTISADAPNADLTLHYQKGLNWVVSVDGVETTYTASAFPIVAPATEPVDDVTKVVKVTGARILVTGVPVDGNYTTSPMPLQFEFSADGLANATTPVTPTVAPHGADSGATGDVTLAAGTGFTWKSSPTYVTDPAAATAPAVTSIKAGETLRYWAVADANTKFSDGTTVKRFDVKYDMTVINKPDAPTWNDQTGTASDTFKVPVVSGVTFYYVFDAAATPVTFVETAGVPNTTTNAAAGWKVAAQGVDIAVPTTTKPFVHVRAVLNDASKSRFETSPSDNVVNLAQASQSWVSPEYTANVVVTPSAPATSDASGADNDTYTFPAATTGVTYTVTANGKALQAPAAGQTYATTYAGKTFTRAQWQAIFPTLTAAELTGPVRFVTAPAPATGYTLAPTATNVAPWDVTLYAGQNITLPSPQFIDNSGVGADDTVKVAKVEHVSQTIKIGGGGARPITDAEYANGIAVPGGSVVEVVATADPGYTLVTAAVKADGTSVLSANNTVATFNYTFNNTAFVTAAEPIADNKAGKTADTYTIVGASGVDYFVNGAPFDAAKFNLPQSTGGADTITVTAKPQGANTWSDGTQTLKKWVLDFTGAALADPVVTNALIATTPESDATFSWSAEGAETYTVTYQKQAPGGQGPELKWLTDTKATSARFIAMAGDTYRIFVVAKDKDGNVSKKMSSDVTFPVASGPVTDGWIDLNNTTATYVGSWTDLRNVPQDYFNKSAMLGYNGAATITLPAGQKHFELYGTIWSNGGAGTLQVNGQNWADFNTRGVVAQPYQQMLRRLNLPDTKAPITIRIIPRNAGSQYLALDAFKYTAQ